MSLADWLLGMLRFEPESARLFVGVFGASSR